MSKLSEESVQFLKTVLGEGVDENFQLKKNAQSTIRKGLDNITELDKVVSDMETKRIKKIKTLLSQALKEIERIGA